jgi:hypothetical protein
MCHSTSVSTKTLTKIIFHMQFNVLYHLGTSENHFRKKSFFNGKLVFYKTKAFGAPLAVTTVIFEFSMVDCLCSTMFEPESDFQVGDLPSLAIRSDFPSNISNDIRRLRRRKNTKHFFFVLHVIYEMTYGIERVNIFKHSSAFFSIMIFQFNKSLDVIMNE